jgi:DNA-binding transcriptional ArsR family regulator
MSSHPLFDYAETVKRQAIAPDVCRNRHRGNAESEAANLVTNKARSRAQIIGLLKEREMTADEISEKLGISVNRLSGRLSELKRDGIVVDTGERRPTRTGSPAAVVRLK